MKILYHHRVGSKDGQAVHVEELIGALRRAGAEIVIAEPASFARASFGHDPKFISGLKSAIPKWLYELLEIGHNVLTYTRLRRAWRAARPDVIYERYNLSLLAGVLLKMTTGTPLILEINAPLMEERAKYDGIGLKRLAGRIQAFIWRNADFVLPVTEVLAKDVRAVGVPGERIRVIPNGIDTSVFLDQFDTEKAKEKLGLSGKIVLGFTGFIRSWHGLDLIVEWLGSADAPHNVHAFIIGDGPAKAELEAQAAQIGARDKITFKGLVDRKDISAMIAAFDVALQPRSVPYASPLKLFEYMALGRAIVAPDQPNIREVLEHDRSALLFPPDDKQALFSALNRLVGDAALRARLGACARETIVSRGFTWDDNAKRVLALADSCLQKPAASATREAASARAER